MDQLLGAIRQSWKQLAIVVALVGGSLVAGWLATPAPRPTWFQQETVTVTKTVTISPWWMNGLEVFVVGLLLLVIGWMLVYQPLGEDAMTSIDVIVQNPIAAILGVMMFVSILRDEVFQVLILLAIASPIVKMLQLVGKVRSRVSNR